MDGERTIATLSLLALYIGFFHTLIGPDHYLPFIVMARARRWSMFKTGWITVLCGIGHLGFRVLEQLVAAKLEVVAIEKNGDGRFIAMAKNLGVPVLIRDMKEDQSLIDAGIQRARAIIIATNDDMANLEVALDARRLNPHIRVLMRLFDQQIAGKIADAMMVDAAFSSSALAAPLVAALSLETRVL